MTILHFIFIVSENKFWNKECSSIIKALAPAQGIRWEEEVEVGSEQD